MLFVSIAAGPALDGHDLAVQPFGHGVRHPVAAISQDVVKVSLFVTAILRIGSRRECAAQANPFLKNRPPGPTLLGIVPQGAQALFDGPSPAHLEIQLFEGLQGGAMLIREILLTLEPEIFGAF